MNVLAVVAHHDDFELGMGATAARLIDEGHRVIVLVMTNSGYEDAAGRVVRSGVAARAEAERSAAMLGFELRCLDEHTIEIPVSDANICSILDIVSAERIDVLFTHWHGDTHPPHRNIHRMVLHASRRVPTVLGFQVNWHTSSQPFQPHIFVPIDDSLWQRKLESYRCYESEVTRAGNEYERFHEGLARVYGSQCGAPRAEAFTAYRFRWDVTPS